MDLTPVGLSKDGKRLVLVSGRGEEYFVAVDHRLRAALRGDHARLGQLEMTMESTLRPRDIQTRIRAGESAEDLAVAAETTLDKIMVYAGPVLAERAHVAQVAQASSVRRRPGDATAGDGGGAGARTLHEAALQHLRSVGLRDDDVTWDAWRRDDGRWTLVAEYSAGDAPHRAELTYDQRGRYVTAEDDEARLLTGELRATAGDDDGRPARRLAAVPSQDELPLGDDAIELVRDEQDELTSGADADWITPDHTGPGAEADHAAHAEEADADAGRSAAAGEDTVEVDPPRRKGRAQVPSWDEIMFGGGGKRD